MTKRLTRQSKTRSKADMFDLPAFSPLDVTSRHRRWALASGVGAHVRLSGIVGRGANGDLYVEN